MVYPNADAAPCEEQAGDDIADYPPTLILMQLTCLILETPRWVWGVVIICGLVGLVLHRLGPVATSIAVAIAAWLVIMLVKNLDNA